MVKQKTETVKPEGKFSAKYCKCSKCGKDKFTRPDIYQKRIEKFGSEKKLQEGYVCRECKKADK